MYNMTVFSYDEVCEIVGHRNPNLPCLDMAAWGSYVRQPCDDDYWEMLSINENHLIQKGITYRHSDEYLFVSFLRDNSFTNEVLVAVDY